MRLGTVSVQTAWIFLVGVYGLSELFLASQEFCGGLTACLFLVVFRLAVKISGGFATTFAKIRLGVYQLRFGGLSISLSIDYEQKLPKLSLLYIG